MLITAHVDQNLIFHRIPSLEVSRQMVGFNDEVIDLIYLTAPGSGKSGDGSTAQQETHLAVATNSDLMRIYNLKTLDVSLVSGHSDVVLCIAKSGDGSLLMSGSKDRSARLWAPRYRSSSITSEPGEEGDATASSSTSERVDWVCVGTCDGHLESIGAVSIAPKEGKLAATASQDKTVKIWDLDWLSSDDGPATSDSESEPQKCRAMVTLKVHDKDINAIDIAPNDRMLVTASQDRTARLFGIDYTPSSRSSPLPTAKLTPLGVFQGHKRGVWSVRFSPTDPVVATASGDKSVKLWSIDDFTCLKTFEGHTNTVLRVDFLAGGAQIATCASDGLVKIWNTKDEECVATLDNHDEKVRIPFLA